MAVSVLQMMLAITPTTFDHEEAAPEPPVHGLPVEVLKMDSSDIADVAKPSSRPVTSETMPNVLSEPLATNLPDLDLSAIARTMRLAEFHRRRRLQAETAFRDLQIVVTKATRLATAARHVQRTLADCLRAEDKYSFARLNNAYADACRGLKQKTTQPDLVAFDRGRHSRPGTGNGFLKDLSSTSRKRAEQLLQSLRYDSSFVAVRLGNLTAKQLAILLPDGGTSRSSGSVFGTSSRTSSRSTQPLGYLVDNLLDDMSVSRFRTPLETLVHLHMPTAYDHPGAAAHLRIWAEVCAILIQRHNPAGPRLLPSLLDIWTSRVPWTGKQKLQSWLLRTLRKGRFILEPNRPTFSARVHGQPKVDAAARAETYYAECVADLLTVLGDEVGSSAIPDGAIMLCQAVHEALRPSPAHQHGLASFVLTRWLFPVLLSDLIVSPESYGLLVDHHVSDLARQRICNEVALRAQRVVSDVFHDRPFAQCVAPETKTLVQQVAARLQLENPSRNPTCGSSCVVDIPGEDAIVSVSAIDTLAVVKALFPASSTGVDFSEIRSSASSTSGFSLFRATEPVEQGWTATPFDMPGAERFPTMFTAPTMEQLIAPATPVDVADALDMQRARNELESYIAVAGAVSDGTWSLFIARDHERKLMGYDFLTEDDPDHSSLQSSMRPSTQTDAGSSIRETLISLLDQWIPVSPRPDASTSDHLAHAPDALESILEQIDAHQADCEIMSDFAGAHHWMLHGDILESCRGVQGSALLSDHVTTISRDARRATDESIVAIEQYEVWSAATTAMLSTMLGPLSVTSKLCAELRTKMWYHADVRTTGAYDNLRSIASGLRTMHKVQRSASAEGLGVLPQRTPTLPSVPTSSSQWKSDNMIQDLLGVTAAHGGPNKLNDTQVKQVQAWRKRNDIHHICVGEERIHKFCMEIQKCVDHFTTIGTLDDAAHNSASSPLSQTQKSTTVRMTDLSTLPHASLRQRMDSLVLQTHVASSIDSVSAASHTLSNASSREYFESRSPTLTSKSSATFWSPTLSEAQSPSSTTSIGSFTPAVHAEKLYSKDADTTADLLSLRRNFTGLLLSEVGEVLFGQGSETDQSFWQGVGGELTERRLHSARASFKERVGKLKSPSNSHGRPRRRPFDYHNAFTQLLHLFADAEDPYTKLGYLGKVQKLLLPFMALTMQDLHTDSRSGTVLPPPIHSTGDDATIDGFYSLFADPAIRPLCIFRDLQYIASLLPSSILEVLPDGKAFWNAVAALTRIKNEMCKIYVETADSIIDFHTNARGHSRSSSQAQQQRDDASFTSPSRTPPLETTTKYTMSDAAHLLQIAAKEGSPVAQRELATLYLTHPDLMDKVLAPWALPKEVFREEIEGRSRRERDLERYDPGTMCVAIHWMVKAAEGGDALAKAHLRQREEMDRLG